MSRIIARTMPALHQLPLGDGLRVLIVTGCALALILAERALPF